MERIGYHFFRHVQSEMCLLSELGHQPKEKWLGIQLLVLNASSTLYSFSGWELNADEIADLMLKLQNETK